MPVTEGGEVAKCADIATDPLHCSRAASLGLCLTTPKAMLGQCQARPSDCRSTCHHAAIRATFMKDKLGHEN